MSITKESPENARNVSQDSNVINGDFTKAVENCQEDLICPRHNMSAKYSDWAYSGAHGCYVDVPYCEKCIAEAEEFYLEAGREDDHAEVSHEAD